VSTFIAILCYGGAIAGTIVAVVILWNI